MTEAKRKLTPEEFRKIKRPTFRDWVDAGFVTEIKSIDHLAKEDRKLQGSGGPEAPKES